MPRPIKKRIPKAAKSHSETELLSDIRDFVVMKQRMFLAAAVAALVVIAIIIAVPVWMNSRSKSARSLEYEGYKLYTGLYATSTMSKTDRMKKAIEMFSAANDIRESPYSLYYIGAANYEIGLYDEAIEKFRELVTEYPNEQNYLPLAYYKTAMSAMHKGEIESALNFFNDLYNIKSTQFKDLALLEAARMLEALGKPEEARAKYEKLIREQPGSPFAAAAKAKVEPLNLKEAASKGAQGDIKSGAPPEVTAAPAAAAPAEQTGSPAKDAEDEGK